MSPTPPSSPTSGGPASPGRRAFQVILLVLAILAVAAALVATASVTSPTSSFPITVDGTSPTDTSSVGYTTGSLYATPPGPDGNADLTVATNTSSYVVSKVTKQSGYWFVGKIQSTKIQADTFAPGSTAAKIALTVVFNGVNIPAILRVQKESAAFSYWVDMNNTAYPASNLGVLVAAQVTTINDFAPTPALVTQFAIPLKAKTLFYPADGQPYRITASYFTPGDQKLLQIADGLVTVMPKGGSNYNTINNGDFVPGKYVATIGNIGSVDPSKNGVVQVTLTGLPSSIVNKAFDPSAFVLRDVSLSYRGDGTPLLDFLAPDMSPGTFFTTGAPASKMSPPQVNADGTVTLTLFFKVTDLVASGGFTIDTTQAELAAAVNGTMIGSKAPVTVSSGP